MATGVAAEVDVILAMARVWVDVLVHQPPHHVHIAQIRAKETVRVHQLGHLGQEDALGAQEVARAIVTVLVVEIVTRHVTMGVTPHAIM